MYTYLITVNGLLILTILYHQLQSKVSYRRTFKYKLNSNFLDIIYNSVILPLLEYASEVCDGCSEEDSIRLERVQLAAARIVTGMPLYESKQAMYRETGWEPLSERRKRKCLILMYKLVNDQAPIYLEHLLPRRVGEVNPYNRRNQDDLIILPATRLSLFRNSFVPASVRLWNNIDPTVRNRPSLAAFKQSIKPDRNSVQQITFLPFDRLYEML